MTKRDIERRLDDLSDPAEGEIRGVAIGYGDDLPEGWITKQEYEAHYPDLEITDFDFTVNGDMSDLEK